MKNKLTPKILSFLLVIATLMTALPLSIFAEEIRSESETSEEVYIKSVRLAEAKTREEAKAELESEGYIYTIQISLTTCLISGNH